MTRIKTEMSEKEKKEGSVGKFLNKVWNTLTPTKKEGMRRKEEISCRKLEMRGFLD